MKQIIVETLLNQKHRTGEQLPSVRQLMTSFKASSGTVQRALKELCSQGVIFSIPSKGYFWGNRTAFSNHPPVIQSPIELLHNRFMLDWRSGAFSHDRTLPSLKELKARYHVSSSLLLKYLSQELQSGFLGRIGKSRFFINSTFQQETKTEVLLITRCTQWGAFAPESEREVDFIRLVYRGAASRRLKLRLLGYNEETNQWIDRNGVVCHLEERKNTIGAIVSTLLIQKPKPFLSALSHLSVPVSIWWEHPQEGFHSLFKKQPLWTFFNSTFGSVPGRMMGRFLLEKGIQKVVYISPYHASSWSQDRLTGLQESGLVVLPFTDSTNASPWDYRERARQNGPKNTVELRARDLLRQRLKKMISKAPTTEAWVCVNDEVAAIIMELFEQKKINKKPYIIGFDNSSESYLLQFDSYDFNTEALVLQMFYHLNSDSLLASHLVEIPGFLVEK